jgi:hypothetical protein
MGGVGVTSDAAISETRGRAARIAALADIRDVRLLKSSAEISQFPTGDVTLSYDLNLGSSVEYEPGSGAFVVRSIYTVSITPATTDDTEGSASAIAKIEFEQAGLFVLSTGEHDAPPTPDELTAYATTTGQFALYPYAREYIYDVTGRLGLPPLTVGVMKLSIPDSTV